uniref:Uncharacterized protein n=1 Tax=Rhizophora mucronata TaxID=61149 RepID=A0A2P2N5K4_RHIMU
MLLLIIHMFQQISSFITFQLKQTVTNGPQHCTPWEPIHIE